MGSLGGHPIFVTNTWHVLPDGGRFLLDETLRFAHPFGQRGLDYWRSKSTAARLPSRAQIDPSEISDLLPHVTLISVEPRPSGQPDYRVRLMGMMMTEIDGERTGQVIEDYMVGNRLRRLRAALDHVVERRQPLRLVSRLAYREWMNGEGIFAPLSSDGAAVDMIFSVAAVWPSSERSIPPFEDDFPVRPVAAEGSMQATCRSFTT